MPHTLNEFDGERSCPIPSPANARLRWCSIWSGMVRQSASRVRAGPGPACPPGLSRGTLFEQPDGIVALLRFGGVQQEDRGTGANFLHRGTAQVVRELRLPGKESVSALACTSFIRRFRPSRLGYGDHTLRQLTGRRFSGVGEGGRAGPGPPRYQDRPGARPATPYAAEGRVEGGLIRAAGVHVSCPGHL